MLYVSMSVFVSFVVYILYLNKEVLYTAQERSEFMAGAPFFDALMMKPFGLIQYAGAWLTQLFHEPLIGASVLSSIWVLIFFVGAKAFRLKGDALALMILPIAFLLTSIVDLGYWIYIFTIKGYWFSQSLGYLIMLVLLWVARLTPRAWHIIWYLIAFCLYPVLGWFSLLFVLCLMVCDKSSWREVIGVCVIFITANIWRILLYSNLKYDDVALAGFPRFVTPSDMSSALSVPFWLLGALSILIAIGGRFIADRFVRFVPVLCAVAGIVYTCSFLYHDKNYVDEMRMLRSAEDEDWGEVLDIFEESSEPTTSMLFLKNVALMNEGGLLEKSFKMKGNKGFAICNPDSLHVSFLQVAAPVVYYNYGLINDGYRISYECAVQTGFSPFFLKMFVRCAYANGENHLATRYLSLLHEHLFYDQWYPTCISEKVGELHSFIHDEIIGIENSDNYLVNSIYLWSVADSKVVSEQALFYSMIRCDSQGFWKSLRKYIKMHIDEEFPLHAQEAYILFMDRAPEEKRMMIPVSQDIYERYKQFWASLETLIKTGVSTKEVPEKMRDQFGDTYWWYNIFNSKRY